MRAAVSVGGHNLHPLFQFARDEERPSEADLAALRRLMGNGDKDVPANAMRTMDVMGSTGYYRVEERIDTVKGGTYVYCPCPGWKFAMGKGDVCKHAREARDIWSREDAMGMVVVTPGVIRVP